MFNWNWPSGSWKKDENVKSLRQQRQRDDDNDRQRTNIYQKTPLKSLAKIKAQMNLILYEDALYKRAHELKIVALLALK